MLQFDATIMWNRPVAADTVHLGLSSPGDFGRARPGQFVMLQVERTPGGLLRRPFSIHNLMVTNGSVSGFELLYKVVGKGTRALSDYREGERLSVLGPLGTSFAASRPWRRVFLVAGGIGVAPLPFLATRLLERGLQPAACRVFVGGRSREDLLCRETFREMGLPVTLTTDDGSAGGHCRITHPVEQALAEEEPDAVFACGPMPMLACIAGFMASREVFTQVSVESMMACGMGACLGCAIPAREKGAPYHHVCIDGPVFELYQLAI